MPSKSNVVAFLFMVGRFYYSSIPSPRWLFLCTTLVFLLSSTLHTRHSSSCVPFLALTTIIYQRHSSHSTRTPNECLVGVTCGGVIVDAKEQHVINHRDTQKASKRNATLHSQMSTIKHEMIT